MALGQYHIKTVALKDLERDIMRALVEQPDVVSPAQEATLRWALALGRLTLIRTPKGHDVDLLSMLSPYRQWLIEHLRATIPPGGRIDGARLRLLIPSLTLRMRAARQMVLNRHVNDFGAEHLDAELRHRKLALVLGGGGGAGLAHIGAFDLLHDIDVVPELIVGSSMGALMGLFRAMERPYSAAAALQVVPASLDLAQLFRPFNGVSRFGLPGAFHMQLIRVARHILENYTGRASIPAFSELPIRLEVVTTGVRTGFASNPNIQHQPTGQSARRMNAFSMRRWLMRSLRLAQDLSADPRLLKQVVFNVEEGTEHFNSVEAVGFSCSVPGLFCYDVFHDDPHTINTLEAIVARHSIWRMTDGGVVNNVPSRVAWESAMRGSLGTRNVFVLAIDVFAPTNSPLNLPYTPIQQVARQNVLANRPFSDYTKTLRSPPSPLNLSPTSAQLKRILDRSRAEMDHLVPLLSKAMTPLPPFEQL